MTWEELYQKCFREESARASAGYVTLVLESRNPPRGDKVCLLPGGRGPRGEVLNHKDEGTVALFKARNIMRYIENNGLR